MKKVPLKNNKINISKITSIFEPLLYSNKLAEGYSESVELKHKKSIGQFFTPINIAMFLGSFADLNQKNIRILDPGFGTGILSIALITNIIEKQRNIKKIILDAYEIDTELVKYSLLSLKKLKIFLEEKNIEFDFNLIEKDFILVNELVFTQDERQSGIETKELYDIVISNPPYFKISLDDDRAKIAKCIVSGQPNIYSLFMYASAKLLKQDGCLIIIVPRSFCSGEYFRLFREKFFKLVQLTNIHIFESRKNNFHNEDVLQENIIVVGKRKYFINDELNVTISSSFDALRINEKKEKSIKLKNILNLNSFNKILHIPTTEKDLKVISIFKSWKGNLNKYNIQISTGPVVAFRAKDYLLERKDRNYNVPLYWLHNVKKMKVYWPLRKKGKYEFIELSNDTKPLLVLNKNYIFLRRFSSKDDNKRLVAAPYFFELSGSKFIGIENHLNYIYRPNGFLERNEILGLSALLNSDLFDTYFRTFNGNINVSSTELRLLPLPSLEDIKKLGNLLLIENDYEKTNIDNIVNKYLNLLFN